MGCLKLNNLSSHILPFLLWFFQIHRHLTFLQTEFCSPFYQTKMPRKIRENLDSLNYKVYYFNMKGKKVDIYQHFIKLTDIFPVHSVGIVTARDKLTIKTSEKEMYKTISKFSRLDEAAALKKFKLRDDTRDWQVIPAQKDIIESGVDKNKIAPILYRPFDLRYTYYTGRSRGFLSMPRPEVMRHMLKENIGLITVRQVPKGPYNHCFVADTIIESRLTTKHKGITFIFPLYKYYYPREQSNMLNFHREYPGKSMPRQSNIDSSVFTRFHELGFNDLPSASQIFYYIYAILNSGIYRKLYRNHLKIDFPRIPFTPDIELFKQISSIGEGLAAIHLMKSSELDQTFSKFPVRGDNLVIEPLFKSEVGKAGRVYINSSQYFSNIPKELWKYKLCGYQVLKKWLSIRRNQKLTLREIKHYIKICRALQLTAKYRKKIDGLYSQLERS